MTRFLDGRLNRCSVSIAVLRPRETVLWPRVACPTCWPATTKRRCWHG